MKCGVVTFPGSNCNHDMMYALGNILNQEVVELWHKDWQKEAYDHQKPLRCCNLSKKDVTLVLWKWLKQKFIPIWRFPVQNEKER